jgi:hypothetical protein
MLGGVMPRCVMPALRRAPARALPLPPVFTGHGAAAAEIVFDSRRVWRAAQI